MFKAIILSIIISVSLFGKDCMSINIVSSTTMNLNYVDAGIEYQQIVFKTDIKAVDFVMVETGYKKYTLKAESDLFNCSITNKDDLNNFKHWYLD